jgi:hypothetical protein
VSGRFQLTADQLALARRVLENSGSPENTDGNPNGNGAG